jgi:hypothetical protein
MALWEPGVHQKTLTNSLPSSLTKQPASEIVVQQQRQTPPRTLLPLLSAGLGGRKAAPLERKHSLTSGVPKSPDWPRKRDGQTVLMPLKSNPNFIIIEQLTKRLTALENCTQSDVILICAPIRFGLDSIVREAVEGITRRKRKASVMLETGGGYIEVTQRIAQTLRKHYRIVNFIIPNYAYSAGTVLAMSGDSILMDYFSVLGPIDPQIEIDRKMVPALGYLEQYKRLVEKSQAGTLTTAELAFLVQRFDPAELYMYEQAKELSISLLKEWLVKYKFKNWKQTKTHRRPVTRKMKVARAEDIANTLNKIEKWNSHGRGIPMSVLRRDLKLVIEDFGQNRALRDCIRDYHHLLKEYQSTVDQFASIVHTRQNFMPLGRA